MSSESDPEGPIAAQMLSFVMDDPDFESDESDTQRRVVRTGCCLGSSASTLPEIEDNQGGLFPRARSEGRQETVPCSSAPEAQSFLFTVLLKLAGECGQESMGGVHHPHEGPVGLSGTSGPSP